MRHTIRAQSFCRQTIGARDPRQSASGRQDFPLPRELSAKGIHRHGFYGPSHGDDDCSSTALIGTWDYWSQLSIVFTGGIGVRGA